MAVKVINNDKTTVIEEGVGWAVVSSGELTIHNAEGRPIATFNSIAWERVWLQQAPLRSDERAEVDPVKVEDAKREAPVEQHAEIDRRAQEQVDLGNGSQTIVAQDGSGDHLHIDPPRQDGTQLSATPPRVSPYGFTDPDREPGKPGGGRKRRTKDEMEEDRLYEERRDAERAQRAAGPDNSQADIQHPHPHQPREVPVSEYGPPEPTDLNEAAASHDERVNAQEQGLPPAPPQQQAPSAGGGFFDF